MTLNCCKKYLFLGCFNPCDSIPTGLFSEQCGLHVVDFATPAGEYQIQHQLDLYEQLVINAGQFLERGVVQFRVRQPDGTDMAYQDLDGETFTCFELEMQIVRKGKPVPTDTYKYDAYCNQPPYGPQFPSSEPEIPPINEPCVPGVTIDPGQGLYYEFNLPPGFELTGGIEQKVYVLPSFDNDTWDGDDSPQFSLDLSMQWTECCDEDIAISLEADDDFMTLASASTIPAQTQSITLNFDVDPTKAVAPNTHCFNIQLSSSCGSETVSGCIEFTH